MIRARYLFVPLKLSYTNGMKTAVSLPDELFQRADQLAKRLEVSRSELYSRALREYLARHAPDEVTESLNRACEGLETGLEDFTREAGRRIFEDSEW